MHGHEGRKAHALPLGAVLLQRHLLAQRFICFCQNHVEPYVCCNPCKKPHSDQYMTTIRRYGTSGQSGHTNRRHLECGGR